MARDESMYADAEAAPASNPESESEGGETTKTALVPKSFCPGMKVGDEFTVRIAAEHEDEFALEYPEPGEEEAEPEAESEAPMGPGGAGPSRMESMME